MVNAILRGFAAVSLLVACARKTDDADRPYRVEVLTVESVPDESAPPRFALAPQTLSSLTSLEDLTGTLLRLRVGGALSIEEISGSVITGDKFEGGRKPLLRYKVRNGVVVPRDYSTLAVLSAYAQFDVIFSRLPETLGLDPADLAASQKAGRYEVLFEPKITLKTDSISGSLAMKRNAAFIPGQGQFVLFERSVGEKVPLGFNLQVLAHEFGHAVFDYTFFRNEFRDDDKYLDLETILGMNEGFADFFSYLVVGSTDMLTASLGDNEYSRERNFSRIGFNRTSMSTACNGEFYCLGSLFAKSLHAVYRTLGESDAAKFRKSLPAALRAARDALDAQNASSEETVLVLFIDAVVGEVAAAVPGSRAPLCVQFANNLNLTFGATSPCGGL